MWVIMLDCREVLIIGMHAISTATIWEYSSKYCSPYNCAKNKNKLKWGNSCMSRGGSKYQLVLQNLAL